MEGVTYTCLGPRVAEDSAQRKGCGADLTAFILAVKKDGQTHEVECPHCGNVSTVTRTPES